VWAHTDGTRHFDRPMHDSPQQRLQAVRDALRRHARREAFDKGLSESLAVVSLGWR
jgi:hypothetical protein